MSGDGTYTQGLRSLDVFDFGVLLQALAQSHKVGTLRVVGGEREKYIHLDRGRVMGIYTPRSRYRIGRILYNNRALEMDALRDVLEEARSGRLATDLGNALLERGLIRREDLVEAFRYQMVEELLEVFYLKETSYEFFGGPPERAVETRIRNFTLVAGPYEAETLLLDVMRLIDDIAKYNEITPSLRDVYEIAADPEDFLLTARSPEQMRSLLELVDGMRDMGEVLSKMRLNRFDVMDLFSTLASAGLIRPKNGFELLMLAENQKSVFPPSKRARLYERVAELGVDGFDISIRTAEVYEELQKNDRAAGKYVEHALKMEKAGNITAAEDAAAHAVQVTPENPDIRRFRADLLKKLDRLDDMASELLEVAGIQRNRGEVGEAEKTLNRALTIRPEDTRVLRANSEIQRLLGKTDASAHTSLELARILERERDLEGAEKSLRFAVEVDPGSLRAHTALANFLALSGEREGAAIVVEKMVPIVVERMADRPDRAIATLKVIVARLRELKVRESTAMSAAAEAFVTLGSRDLALELLRETGEARIASNRWPDAADAFGRAVELAPEDLDLAETLALINAQIGDRDTALARLRGIAGQYRKRGKPDRAERAYREMLRLNPFSPDALLELARLKAEQGDRKSAAERMYQIGVMYRTTGRAEDAAEYYDEACRYDPSNPEYVRALADCLQKVLKTRRCLDSFDALLAMLRARNDLTGTLDVALRILEIEPKHEMAAQAIADCHRSLGRHVEQALR